VRRCWGVVCVMSGVSLRGFTLESNTLWSYVFSCVILRIDHHPIAVLISTELVYHVHLTANLVVNLLSMKLASLWHSRSHKNDEYSYLQGSHGSLKSLKVCESEQLNSRPWKVFGNKQINGFVSAF